MVMSLNPGTEGSVDIFHIIFCNICIVCLKKTENNQKEAKDGPLKIIYKLNLCIRSCFGIAQSLRIWSLGLLTSVTICF